MFRFVLLGLLRDGVARHGYALMKEYRRRTGVVVSTGNFYRELQRLVVDGLVAVAERDGGSDLRQCPYRITACGTAEFEAWFAAPRIANDAAGDDFAARVLFLGHVPDTVARSVLRVWQDELWIRAKHLESEREKTLRAADADFPALTLLLTRRMRRVAADLSFLEELRTTFERWVERVRPPVVPQAASLAPVATRRSRREP